MPPVTLVAIRRLNENGRVAEALGKDLSTNVVETNSFTNVTSRLFHDRITVNIGQETEAKAFGIAWISETVHCDGRL